MLGRRIAQEAVRAAARPSTSLARPALRCIGQASGRRLASTSTLSSGSSSTHAGGPNSMLVGAAGLAATLVAGYVLGRGGQSRTTLKLENPVQSSKADDKKKSLTKTTSKPAPAAIVRKADEANESVKSSSTSNQSSSKKSTSSSKKPSSVGPVPSEGEAIVAKADQSVTPSPPPSSSSSSSSAAGAVAEPAIVQGAPSPTSSDAEDESGEDASQAAFNPETGEINWDCPCLGGMAHGVCGEDFKAAFSCFIYSEAEPKGADCIEKFRGMQDCFRAHPEIYGEVAGEDGEFDDLEDGYDVVQAVEAALEDSATSLE